ncbi:MAG: histidine phosphatase family protein [Actinobacteria bacterium]|nr:histidine phosphatase family protein [Actinomycetota bacterium]
MSESIDVILVRHGRTAFNATGRIQGRIDNPLDDLGLEQANRVGRRLARDLAGHAILVHSPLLRARQTADVIAATSGKVSEIVIDPDWIELDYGTFDGLHQSEVDAKTWRNWRADPTFRPPGGESLVEVEDRVRLALDRLLGLGARSVIVVSHVSPIKAAVTLALGVNTEVVWRTRLDTASICRLSLSSESRSLTGFNETGHLDDPPYVSHG